MTSRALLVGPAVVFSNAPGAALHAEAGVACADGRIVEVGPWQRLARTYADATHLEAEGKVILPGLINAHHHLYSTFARGMPIPCAVPLDTFQHILEGIWWRLDQALDLDAVAAGAVPPAIDCLRWGVTTLFDHHASPNAIRGSLDAVARVCDSAGLRAALCYEVSDRNGPDRADAGVEENAAFHAAHKGDPRCRALLGLHASFTVSDDTLRLAAARLPPDVPIHIHIAEDPIDVETTRDRHQCGIVERLDRFGLLRPNSLLAHCVHLDEPELRRIAAAHAWVVHNPESNANNAVGAFDVERALRLGVRVALGTDGMASNMLRAAKSAFLMARHTRGSALVGMQLPRTLLFEANVQLAQELFGEPLLGRIAPGAPADLCVVDYESPTELSDRTLDAHLVFGLTEAPVSATVSDGLVRWDRGGVYNASVGAIGGSVQAAAARVWNKLP